MRLRFTIRDLLWLTLVVAMGVGWWFDRERTIYLANSAQQQSAIEFNAMRQDLIDVSNRLAAAMAARSTAITGPGVPREKPLPTIPPAKTQPWQQHSDEPLPNSLRTPAQTARTPVSA